MRNDKDIGNRIASVGVYD